MKLKASVIFLFLSLAIGSYGQNQPPEFYDSGKIPQIRIRLKQESWRNYLDSMRLYGDGLLIASVNIDGQEYKNVGVRYQEHRSFGIGAQRNPLFIKLDFINKNQSHQGFSEIVLSNALRDPSMVREVLGYEIARQYMPAPYANYAKVYVNDTYYGLMVNIEAINDEFLERHFKSRENTFISCTPPEEERVASSGCKNKIYASLQFEEIADCFLHNYVLLSENGWDDLIELTRVLDKDPANIHSILNVDQALWMLAFNNLTVNLSSYSGQHSQNYFLYKDNFGRFNPIVWDLNLAFGSFKNTGEGSDLDLEGLQELDPLLHAENESKPLISNLLKEELYKKTYLSHLRTILYDHFVDGDYLNRAQSLQQLIASAIAEDTNKFYSQEEFTSSLTSTIGQRSRIPGVMELMSKRARFLKKHPELSVVPPEISEVSVSRREKFSNITIEKFQIQAKVDKRPKKVRIFYRLSDQTDYSMAFMMDDGKNHDGSAGDKIFGVSIDPGSSTEIEYYIVAENPGAISFDPPNYMFAPRRANLEELNR